MCGKLFLAVLLTFSALSLGAQEQKSAIVQLVVNPPYTYEPNSEGSDPVGFIPDLFRHLKVPGWKFDLQVKPWVRAYNETLNGGPSAILLPTLVRNTEREPLFRWVAPLFSVQFFFFGTAGKPAAVNVAALKKAHVGVIRGDVSETWLLKQGFTNLESLTTSDQLVKMLQSGRVDYLVKDVTAFHQLLKTEGLSASQFAQVVEIPELRQDLYVAGSLSSPPELIAALAAALDKLKKDGTFESIRSKWF